jgi:hypothetical protein
MRADVSKKARPVHGLSAGGRRKSKRLSRTAAQLRVDILNYLESTAAAGDKLHAVNDPVTAKALIREIHLRQRTDQITWTLPRLRFPIKSLVGAFANGREVHPTKIRPSIRYVAAGSFEADLFRFASLTWSVPVSFGFGRRTRYLVFDDQNRKLMGLIALGDPVFNLTARDRWIGWGPADRKERLVSVVDAFVLGAVPPYSRLIGGKLIAALACSREVVEDFESRHSGKKSVISGRRSRKRLACITTTSALGKSSIYARLRIPEGVWFTPVGSTMGFGHFHFPRELFLRLRKFLVDAEHPYANANRFGQGPNWKFRVIRVGLEELGLDPRMLRHGITREVYVVPLARNAREFLKGKTKRLERSLMSVKDVSRFCMDRWVIPRSRRDRAFRRFKRGEILAVLGDLAGRPLVV